MKPAPDRPSRKRLLVAIIALNAISLTLGLSGIALALSAKGYF